MVANVLILCYGAYELLGRFTYLTGISCCAYCTLNSYDCVAPGVRCHRNLGLCYEDLVTYGAVLTLGKTYCRTGGSDRLIYNLGVTECVGYLLCNEHCVTYGAMLALGKTGFGTGCINCCVYYLGVTECVNDSLVNGDFTAGKTPRTVGKTCSGTGSSLAGNLLGACVSTSNVTNLTANVTVGVTCTVIFMTCCGNCVLCNGRTVTSRAVLTLGKTGFGTGCINCRVNYDVVAKCVYALGICMSRVVLTNIGVRARLGTGRSNRRSLLVSVSESLTVGSLTSRAGPSHLTGSLYPGVSVGIKFNSLGPGSAAGCTGVSLNAIYSTGGRCGYYTLVPGVSVLVEIYFLGLGLITSRAIIGLDTLYRAGRRSGNLTVVPIMTKCGNNVLCGAGYTANRASNALCSAVLGTGGILCCRHNVLMSLCGNEIL